MTDHPSLSRSSSAESALFSLAAHELRTPASVVGGYLHMLQQDTDGSYTARQRKMIDGAVKSCARLIEIIAEISDIAKLDSGSAPASTGPFDLFTVLSEVVSTTREATDRDVHLVARGPNEGAPMNGDLFRTKQAFAAIFRAILREQPAACTVVAEWSRRNDGGRPRVLIVVAPETSIESADSRPLVPFDDTRGGLGLALPIARRIIERAGGSMLAPASPTDGTAERGTAVISFSE